MRRASTIDAISCGSELKLPETAEMFDLPDLLINTWDSILRRPEMKYVLQIRKTNLISYHAKKKISNSITLIFVFVNSVEWIVKLKFTSYHSNVQKKSKLCHINQNDTCVKLSLSSKSKANQPVTYKQQDV